MLTLLPHVTTSPKHLRTSRLKPSRFCSGPGSTYIRLLAETRWKAGDERAKAAEEERDRLKVHAEALAADFAAANAFVETANARIRAAEQDRDRQKARADAAEARVRELEEKLKLRANCSRGDDTE